MDTNSAQHEGAASRPSRWKLVTSIAGVIVAIVLISCATVTRTVLAPPEIPGAEFVGTHTCAECHENRIRWSVKYGFFTHDDYTSRGRNNYEAHLVYSTLRVMF